MATFYEDNPEQSLRFGDVIIGFETVTPQLHAPGSPSDVSKLEITVTRPSYHVVVTPCCSIEDKAFALAPLLSIRPSFVRNPFFAEDLTRINRKVAGDKSVAPEVWEKLPPERKAALTSAGEEYTLNECFIYAPHNLLKTYALHTKGGSSSIGHYLLDFKTIFRVECNQVNRGDPAPKGVKILQLTPWSREELRQKLALYFARVPEEDAAILG